MKDYLNAEERTYLIIILAMQETVEKFSKYTCLSGEERHCLEKVTEWSKKFNGKILDRIGEVLRRKIVRTMDQNDLRLVGKYGKGKDAISEAATEDLKPVLSDLHLFHCNGCGKSNYKDCAVYAISVACDMEENNTGYGCPFLQKTIDFPDDDF